MIGVRQDAIDVLSGWQSPDREQDGLRREYLQLLHARTDACSRSCHPDHLTASAIIVSADLDRVALTLHARLGRWLQTGGHIEPADLTLADAALREAREESGLTGLTLDPDPLRLSRHVTGCGPTQPAHHLDVQFLALAHGSEQLVTSGESHDVAWFALDALPEGDDSTVTALSAAACRRLSLPSRP